MPENTHQDNELEKSKLAQLKSKLSDIANISKDLAYLITHDEDEIQRVFAPKLRRAAIRHLAHGRGIVAEGFRGEYSAVSISDSNREFLQKQARDGEWATYIEATALGELLGCNVVVTYQRPGAKDSTWCLYRALKDAPTIHLYNTNNTHWYANHKTRGDGNCLYNAFGQALKQMLVMDEPKKAESASATGPVTQPGLFKPIVVLDEAIQRQDHVIRAIESHPTCDELKRRLEMQHEVEQDRLSRLSPPERAKIETQMREDYALALRLAREEIVSPSYKPKK